MPLTGQQHYDVAIIGAGLAGSSLACALTARTSAEGLSLLLVEASEVRADAEPAQPGYDMRSTVLSAGTVTCFKSLGLWDDCCTAAEAIATIHVSDQGRFGSVKLSHTEEGVEALGYVVENARLGYALNRALRARQGIEIRAPMQVEGLLPQSDGLRLVLRSGETSGEVTASLVVLAEGGRSGLCAQLGISHDVHDYGQSAIIANVSFTEPHRQVAYERFTPKGPLALLPLPDHDGEHRAALVWTHGRAGAKSVLALPDADFLDALEKELGTRLGRFTRVGKRACFPLNLQVAEEQIRPGLVLLGNVAHTLHPVAGQGFNLAMRDTMILADTILRARQQGASPGDYRQLQHYLDQARGDQRLTIAFSDYMTRLFSSKISALVWARQFGMASIDLLPPLRRSLARQAMGLAHPRVRI